jgi:mono/diheme cytochrome c family protein
LILSLACATSGCDLPGRPDPDQRPVPADEVAAFDPLFKTNCSGCHGADGKSGAAPPLNDALFLSIVPDDELERVIAAGRPGTPMAAFARQVGGPLTEAQVKTLAGGLKDRWKSAGKIPAEMPPYLAPQDNPASRSPEGLARGEKAFARACAVCHGAHGEGTGKVGAISDPAFLGLISDQALRRLVITGRPDLGMPNFADKDARGADYEPLSSDEIDELVAFLGSWRQALPSSATKAANAAEQTQQNVDEKDSP